jgi:hypothetical protein
LCYSRRKALDDINNYLLRYADFQLHQVNAKSFVKWNKYLRKEGFGVAEMATVCRNSFFAADQHKVEALLK